MTRAIPGRPRRKRGVPRVSLRARVEPDTLDRVYAVAEALGVSLTAYVEELIRHDQLDERGRPVWWTDSVPTDQEELPLTQTA